MTTIAPIKRESIPTASQEEWLTLRTRDITSTESAALFGISPYLTPFELWHRKKAGLVVEAEPNERMKWGTRLQDSIAAGIAEDQKWEVKRRAEYERLPELRLGSSFDFTILGGKDADGLLEIKNVDPLALRDNWIVNDDEIEAPPHIEMQVQHQLLVSGLPYAFIGALVGGNRVVLIRREPSPKVIQGIVSRSEEFWKSIKDGKEPQPDFSKDSAFIAKLYSEVKGGRVVNVADDAEVAALAADYERHKKARDEHEKAREEVKARLFMKLPDAEKAIGKDFSISLGSVKATRVEAFDRAAYRNCRVTFKKKD